jgi:hypothetical protein
VQQPEPSTPVNQARGQDPETESFWKDYIAGTPPPEPFRYSVPPSPAVPQRDYVQQPSSPVDQARGLDPAAGSFRNDYNPGTPSPDPLRYNVSTPSPVTSVDTELLKSILDQTQRTIAKMDDWVKELLTKQVERDAARDKEMAELKAMITALSSQGQAPQQTAAELQKAQMQATLEAEKKRKMAELEDELRPKWEAAGLAFTPLTRAHAADNKAENPKSDLIGIVNPLPSHKDWTGQSVDANGQWLSFSKWLGHLKQVLDQKESVVWKRAVLDVASLTCLRGRALDWWHALLPQQQTALREDFTLEMWNTLGKALHRNEQILRKEARDRKRQFGESLSEYAWKKLAMLQEAFGRNREAADLIADIKDGLTPADQEAIRSDLHSTPTVTAGQDTRGAQSTRAEARAKTEVR